MSRVNLIFRSHGEPAGVDDGVGTAIDGAMVDGAAVDGAAVDGADVVVDGAAVDGATVEGACVDGADAQAILMSASAGCQTRIEKLAVWS